MRVAAWRTANRTWSWDQAHFDRMSIEWEGLGAPTIFLPRINVQRLFIDDMGVEDGTYALLDWPDEIAAWLDTFCRLAGEVGDEEEGISHLVVPRDYRGSVDRIIGLIEKRVSRFCRSDGLRRSAPSIHRRTTSCF